MNLDHLPAMLSFRKVADLLGIGLSTVYRYCDSGILPSTRIGSRRLVPRDKLQEFLKSNTRDAS